MRKVLILKETWIILQRTTPHFPQTFFTFPLSNFNGGPSNTTLIYDQNKIKLGKYERRRAGVRGVDRNLTRVAGEGVKAGMGLHMYKDFFFQLSCRIWLNSGSLQRVVVVCNVY